MHQTFPTPLALPACPEPLTFEPWNSSSSSLCCAEDVIRLQIQHLRSHSVQTIQYQHLMTKSTYAAASTADASETPVALSSG